MDDMIRVRCNIGVALFAPASFCRTCEEQFLEECKQGHHWKQTGIWFYALFVPLNWEERIPMLEQVWCRPLACSHRVQRHVIDCERCVVKMFFIASTLIVKCSRDLDCWSIEMTVARGSQIVALDRRGCDWEWIRRFFRRGSGCSSSSFFLIKKGSCQFKDGMVGKSIIWVCITTFPRMLILDWC